MTKSYLSAKQHIYDIAEEISTEIKNDKEIYPDDEEKKDMLEEEIKRELKNEFHVMFQKLKHTEEDKKEVEEYIKNYIKKNKYFFKQVEDYHTFVSNLVNSIFGLGVLQGYIEDPTITEIWVLGCNHIYYEKDGKRWESPLKFKNDTVIRSEINKILAPINRKADELNSTVDGRLQNGSRIAVTLPPNALGGPELVIRKFKEDKFGLDKYVEYHSMTPEMAQFLSTSVAWGANILVCGGTGSGKTTLLNALTSEIPRNDETKEYEHIITIEDSAELIVDNPFTQRWETRVKNSEGKGEVTASNLVKHALRNSPDRIILGEIRDSVAYDVLQAAMTGHKGTMSTIHAETPRQAGVRFSTLAGSAEIVTAQEAEQMFSSCFDLVVVVEKIVYRDKDGNDVVRRVVTNISHIVGFAEDGASKLPKKPEKVLEQIYYQDIFKFNKITKKFECTGYIPKDLMNKALYDNIRYDQRMFTKKVTE